MEHKKADKPIVFFDGHCTLCSHWINFMLKRDRLQVLQYASLQGDTAKAHLNEEHLKTIDTIILKVGDKLYFQSSASLRSFAYLGGIYKAANVLLLFPPFIRNWVYSIVSKNRYQWFGKKEVCRVPTEEEAGRLLP